MSTIKFSVVNKSVKLSFFQGKYMYADMSNDQLDDYARLLSPTVTAPSAEGVCMRFWYHMYGSDVNRLRVYYKQRDYTSATLWQRSNSQGPFWIMGEVSGRDGSLF